MMNAPLPWKSRLTHFGICRTPKGGRRPSHQNQHRQHKGLNNRAENSHQPTRLREKVMRRFKSAGHLQRFASVHDQVARIFMLCRYHTDARKKRALRTQAFEARESVTCAPMLERIARLN
jgi:putative transposase